MCENLFCTLLLYNFVHETYIITGFFVQIPAISLGASGSSPIYPADTVLLETRMRYGAISYHSEDVLKWKERWQPSERLENDLRMHHQKKPEVKVRFHSDKYGRVQCTVIETTPSRSTRLKNYSGAPEPEFIPLSSQDARQEVGLFPCYILSVYFDLASCTVFLFAFSSPKQEGTVVCASTKRTVEKTSRE